jgi:spermidine synthase
VIRWVQLDTADLPEGGQLRLMQRGDELSIMAGATELMNSRLSGSEEALATLACERLQERRRPHLLVGGLGMGFTLRAALAALGSAAEVTVVELSPAVAAWARGPMAGLFAGSLEDPRTHLVEADVVKVIDAARARFHAILLDVDNGPEGLTRAANDRLYNMAGLAAAKRALKPGGVLAVWSSAPNPAFTKRLRTAGYAAEEVPVRARGVGRRGARHMIWLAKVPG